ncbi:unnamed protein product, partial [Discosporangium mesarthrocarpum]
MTSCLKDEKFLAFFFKRMRPNDLVPPRHPLYSYISPCGREMNFVLAEDVPIVFQGILTPQADPSDGRGVSHVGAKSKGGACEPRPQEYSKTEGGGGRQDRACHNTSGITHLLISTGGLKTPFIPSELRVSRESGRLYHPFSWGFSGKSRGCKSGCGEQGGSG